MVLSKSRIVEPARDQPQHAKSARHKVCGHVGGEGKDTDRPDTHMQDMLANFSLGEGFVRAFELPIDELEGESKAILKDLMNTLTSLLTQYVNGNPGNQMEMYGHVDKMYSWFHHGVGVVV